MAKKLVWYSGKLLWRSGKLDWCDVCPCGTACCPEGPVITRYQLTFPTSVTLCTDCRDGGSGGGNWLTRKIISTTFGGTYTLTQDPINPCDYWYNGASPVTINSYLDNCPTPSLPACYDWTLRIHLHLDPILMTMSLCIWLDGENSTCTGGSGSSVDSISLFFGTKAMQVGPGVDGSCDQPGNINNSYTGCWTAGFDDCNTNTSQHQGGYNGVAHLAKM